MFFSYKFNANITAKERGTYRKFRGVYNPTQNIFGTKLLAEVAIVIA